MEELKNDYKIIAFDLDDTLAESKQAVSENMISLLITIAHHKKVIIISGGMFEQFKKQFLNTWVNMVGSRAVNIEEQELLNKSLILLPTSGSQCYEYDSAAKEWKMTDIEEFPAHLKGPVIEAMKKIIASQRYDIPVVPTPENGEIIEDRLTQITFSALGQNASPAIKRPWDPDQKKRQAIRKELEPQFPEVDIKIGGLTSIDVLPKSFNKARGLERLLKRKELDKKDILFYGDAIFPGGNDYSVFEAGMDVKKVTDPEDTARQLTELLKSFPKVS